MQTNEYPIDQIRHSASHVLALAVSRLFPEVKIGVGPVTKDGFYYDFEFTKPITWENVKRIEAEMNLIIQSNLPFNQIIVPKESAYQILLTRGQVYKAELLQEIADAEISFFKTGEEFVDLCRGPHVGSTGEIGAVKLTSLSDSFWKGDETRPQMQRISGVAFHDYDGLKLHVEREQQISSRDFRNIGRDMGLTIGGTKFISYTGKGTQVIKTLDQLIEAEYSDNYLEINIPPMRTFPDTFKAVDDVFSRKNRSYRELPLRLWLRSRQELVSPISIQNKEIHSVNIQLQRSYVEPQELGEEVSRHIRSAISLLKQLFPKFSAKIVTPNQTSPNLKTIIELLKRENVSQTLLIDANQEPTQISITFKVTDSFERDWIMATISMNEADVQFVAKTGDFINAGVVNTTWILERALAYYLEEFEGGFPFWLSPAQVRIVPITQDQVEHSEQVLSVLVENGYRAEIDARSETMQSRIRDTEIEKVPVVLVIGEKETQNNAVSLRLRNQAEVGLVSETELLDTISRFSADNHV